jgi:hypothetical protein
MYLVLGLRLRHTCISGACVLSGQVKIPMQVSNSSTEIDIIPHKMEFFCTEDKIFPNIFQALVSKGFSPETKAVIAGLSNSYSDYIATFEEYQVRMLSTWPEKI